MALFALAQEQATPNPNCKKLRCPFNYDPVCATPRSGGIAATFGNECGARSYGCQNNLGEFFCILF